MRGGNIKFSFLMGSVNLYKAEMDSLSSIIHKNAVIMKLSQFESSWCPSSY